MDKVKFEVGELVTPAKVNEDGTITPAVRKGTTPLSPFLLNQIQENIEKDQTRQDNEMTNTQNKIIKVLQEVETPTPVSGENIDITDSAEAKITELNISGNSKQKTSVEGKNKFDSKNVSYYTKDSRETYIINSSNSITVNGTECSWTRISITIPNLKPSTEYTISAKVTNASNHNAGFLIEDDNNVVRSISTNANFTSKITFITDSNGSITIQVFSNWSGTVLTESVTYDDIQLEEGETVTEYEEFEPNMPSSEYSSEVESCGDNVNLIGIPETSEKLVSGVNVSASNEIVNLNGTNELTYNSNLITDILYSIEEATNYNLSITEIAGTREGLIGIKGIDSNETQQWYIQLANTSVSVYKEITAEQISNTASIRLFIGGSAIFNDYQFKIKLEKGSKATPYSPYGQGCINEVICNKNILDLTEFNGVTSNGLTSKVADDGKVTITGTLSSAVNTHLRLPYIFTKSMLGKTLTLSTSGTTNFNLENITNIGFKEANTSINNNTYINPTKLKTTFEVTEDVINRVTNLDFYFVSTITNVNISFYLQLEEGSTATDYVKHQSQIYTIPTQQPMRSKKDTFIKKNNKWFERHYGNRYIFTGTENVSLQNSGKRIYVPHSKNTNIAKPVNSSNDKLYCNYLLQTTALNTWNGVQGISYDVNSADGYEGFDIAINAFTTAQEYLDWFAEKYNEGKPFYVDYVLAEPIDIECTEEQSEILWDIEQNAKTYDKVTHMYSTDKISPVIEVTYKKDIETLFANTLVEGV